MKAKSFALALAVVLFSTCWTDLRAAPVAPPYIIVPPTSQGIHSETPQQTKLQSEMDKRFWITAGQSPTFHLEFADVRDRTGKGFDDPLQGNDRRAIALAVFERLSRIFRGEPGSARILIDSRSPWLNQDTLGIGIPFFQCTNGFQKPIIFNALKKDAHVHTHEGQLLVNFELPQSASMEAPPIGKYDLFTVLFHEAVHILGFVGFTVEPGGRPKDCGGARMMPAIAMHLVDRQGRALWQKQGEEIQFVGNSASLPSALDSVFLNNPQASSTSLMLQTGSLSVAGHWRAENFSGRDGVLMLENALPTATTRRNMTPETKGILQNVLGYTVNQSARGLTGSWIDPEFDGQGFTLHFVSAKRFVIYYFGFTETGERLWMLGIYSEAFKLGETLRIPLIEAAGGNFNHFTQAAIKESAWGSLDIRFKDCLSAEATLNGMDGMLEMTLVQLAGVDTLECF